MHAAVHASRISISEPQRYSSNVKQIWTGRAAQAAGKYAEHAPVATACCNTCRTCVTTNIFALAGAGAVGVLTTLRRFARAS
jgi:hypothetical protein